MTVNRILVKNMSKQVVIIVLFVCLINLSLPLVEANGNSSMDLLTDFTPWSNLLEEATLGQSSSRNGRILLPTNYVQHNTFNPSPQHQYYDPPQNQFIPANNYYFSNRLDNVETIEYDSKPTRPKTTTHRTTLPPPASPQPYQNYAPVRQNHYQQNLVPSQREISETDLFLLSAIEKLTYKVDYMEKRLKKTEQLLYYIMEGNGPQDEHKPACPGNFTLIGDTCYFIGDDRGLNWKSAAAMCKSLGGQLAELDPITRQKDVIFRLINDFNFRGKDFWVGGLNPGLLWIWINSGKPVNPNTKLDKVMPQRKGRIIVPEAPAEVTPVTTTTTEAPESVNETTVVEVEGVDSSSEEEESEGKVINGQHGKGPTTPQTPKIINKPPVTSKPGQSASRPFKDDPTEIKGQGRCLRLSYNPSTHTYGYTGVDCVQRSNYLCELKDRTSENEISRIAKSLNFH